MSTLRDIQENFQRYLQQDDTVIEQYIAASAADFATERLSLYKDAYYIRLVDALEKDYPGIFALLGDVEFDSMATTYIEQKPSRHFSINEFGSGMSAFLAEIAPYATRPELAEMAQFERTLNKAIHTLDAPVLLPEALMQTPQERWPESKIMPHPSAQILMLSWNIPALWLAAVEKKPLPAIEKTDVLPWLVWQKDINTYYLQLSPQDAYIMESLKGGLCMGEICEGLCQWFDEEEVPQYLVQTILNWLHDKLLSRIDLS